MATTTKKPRPGVSGSGAARNENPCLRSGSKGYLFSIAKRCKKGMRLPLVDWAFSAAELRAGIHLMATEAVCAPWHVAAALHDVDLALGGQDEPTLTGLQAGSLISRHLPDDRQAVAILSRALPGVGGRPHRLVRRFAKALCRWRRERREEGSYGNA